MMGLPTAAQHMSDLGLEVDPEIAQLLDEAGVDSPLRQHIAYLFSRDPLVIFRERVELDDDVETDHFESLQSSNWNSVRWKPPPSMNSSIGWRTEFRPMETQLTDFENAAFAVVVVLLARTILAFDLDLVLPISKVDENMERAHARDAVLTEKFFFARVLAPRTGRTPLARPYSANGGRRSKIRHNCEYEEMTIAEILNGKGDGFPGLLSLVQAYVDSAGCDAPTRLAIDEYFQLIAMRADGSLMTNAAWMRKFVTTHPDYQGDSVVPPTTAHDLMKAAHEIGTGERCCEHVLGEIVIEPISPRQATWDAALETSSIDCNETETQSLSEASS